MSFNEKEIITNPNDLEKGNEYFIKFWHSDDIYYNGIYTFIGDCFDNYSDKLLFANVSYNIMLSPGVCLYVSGKVYFIGEAIKINSNKKIFIEDCNIFKISTTEYVLK